MKTKNKKMVKKK